MGRIKRTTSNKDDKEAAQTKISTFFMGGQSDQAKPSKSLLFSSVGQSEKSSNAKQSTKKPLSFHRSENIDRLPTNKSQIPQQTNVGKIVVIDDDEDDIIPNTPDQKRTNSFHPMSKKHFTTLKNPTNNDEGDKSNVKCDKVKEKYSSSTIMRSATNVGDKTDISAAKSESADTEGDANSEIIPRTPESEQKAKKRPYNRSFMGSSVSFNCKLSKPVKDKPAKNKAEIKSLEERLKERASNEPLEVATFCPTTGAILPSVSGLAATKSSSPSHTDSPCSSIHKKHGLKRRSSHDDPTLSKRVKVIPDKLQEPDSDIENNKPLESGIEEPYDKADSDENVIDEQHHNESKSEMCFIWRKKSIVNKVLPTNKAENVDDLNDILLEMKCNEKTTISKDPKSKLLPQPNKKLFNIEGDCDKQQKKEEVISVDSQEADSAFDDIMCELRHTLTPKIQPQSEQKRRSSNEIINHHEQTEMRQNPDTVALQLNLSTGESDMETNDVAQEEKKRRTSDADLRDLQVLQQQLEESFGEFSPVKPTTNSQYHKKEVTSTQLSNDAPVFAFGRHKILKIYGTSEKELLVSSEINGQEKQIILEGSWSDVHVGVGDIVHVLSEFDENGVCRITDTDGFLVVNPDLLISGTSVVSGVYCMRRAVLNEKFKGIDSRNIHMLQGSIIHLFFQKVVQQQAYTTEKMKIIAEKVLTDSNFLHEMYALGVSEGKIMEEVLKFLPTTKHFLEKHVPPKQHTFGHKRAAKDDFVITNVADIEENIWSPRYGIKGKIDMTVEIKKSDDKNGKNRQIMPLELKTGRPSHSIEHKGQVTLYSMMLSDRRQDPEAGLLLYLKDGSLTRVPANYQNKRGLIQLRNELTHYVKSSTRVLNPDDLHNDESHNSLDPPLFHPLPHPINSHRSCSNCPHLLNCTAYQRTMENLVLPSHHDMNSLIPEALSHLSEDHLKYFSRWCSMLHLEQSADNDRGSGISAIWCKTANESGSLLNVGLTKSDYVAVSAQDRPLIALCTGFLHEVTTTKITLLTDRDFRLYAKEFGDLIYRVEKCDSFNTMGYYFTNLTRIMENSVKGSKLRELLIERRSPLFDLTMSKNTIEKVKGIFKVLNKPQKTAVLKVLMCKDYVLVKGYPGTGKTSTIVALVRILVSLGHSILLASYTHSAVDNILLKLKQHKTDFVRIGRLERIHPDLKDFSAEKITRDMDSVSQIDKFYSSKPVVATTCLGTNHAVFARRTFDFCIIDEASQVLQPACFGPLLCAEKFVLVGDPLQLPPVVQSGQAKNLGMAVSLFARLDDTGGTYELNLQYRMNKEIMRLSNELVYNGALKCGVESVADAKLCLTNSQALHDAPHLWIQEALSDLESKEVVFLDTSKVSSEKTDEKNGGKSQNRIEAAIATRIVHQALQAGICEDDIGVIAPYRQQVRLLRDIMTTAGLSRVEVNTVDQYQGRDKVIIIITFVKNTTGGGHAGEILQDLRRLNVALTRAKHKHIMIGNTEVLKTYSPVQKLLDILRPEQITVLPSDVASSIS